MGGLVDEKIFESLIEVNPNGRAALIQIPTKKGGLPGDKGKTSGQIRAMGGSKRTR